MRSLLLGACALLLLLPGSVRAHEVPARVTIHAFVRADDDVLRVLVRVPLEAIRDIEWPLHDGTYLDLAGARPLLGEAAQLWIADYLELYENDVALRRGDVVAARISLPSDRSFGSWPAALAHTTGPPLAEATRVPWQQALFDVLLEYPIASAESELAVRPLLAHLGVTTTTVLRYVAPDGAERALQYVGDPGLVRLEPRWYHAAAQFVKLGFTHILGGLDHLLFILCLVIPFRRFRPLVLVVTSFTLAHSITLGAAALGPVPTALWFPPLIETLIAASIVYMAFENIVGARVERRWVMAFAFGLVHGFGFSFLLRESLQFAGGQLAASLLAFNIGVELGQLAVLVVLVPALALLLRHVPERIGVILLSAVVAHTGWHWMTARGGELLEYSFEWPAFDALLLAGVLRWLMIMAVAALAVTLLTGWRRRMLAGSPAAAPDRPETRTVASGG